MSAVGLGCVSLGSGEGRSVRADVDLVRCAVDLGVRVFDTSDAYGSGASEHVLGRALRGRRDDVVVATKGGFAFRARPPAEQWARRRAKGARAVVDAARAIRAGSGPRAATNPPPGAGPGGYAVQELSPQHLRRAVHASLRRLGTDRIDVYQVHAPEDVLPHLFEELVDLVSAGDVGRFGVGAGTVASADAWSEVNGVGVVQVPFGVLDPEAAATTLPSARRRGQEVWVRGVLGGGVMGLFTSDPASLDGHPKLRLVSELDRFAKESGLNLQELAIRFVLGHADEISTVLVGTSSPEHLRRNVSALSAPPLPPDLMDAVTALVDTTGSSA